MFDAPMSLVAVSVLTEPKRTIREEVYNRVRAGLCIHHDDSPDGEGLVWCDCKSKKVGLCDKHYGEYRNLIMNLPSLQVVQIESKLAHEGQWLMRQLVRRIKRESATRKIVKEVTGRAAS